MEVGGRPRGSFGRRQSIPAGLWAGQCVSLRFHCVDECHRDRNTGCQGRVGTGEGTILFFGFCGAREGFPEKATAEPEGRLGETQMEG